MDLEDLVLRIPKGSPLTPLEMDENLDALRDAINGLATLFGVALNPDGSLKNPYVVYGVSAGGTDAYQITPVPAVASMASLIGRLIILDPRVQNTGPATLEIIGVGAVSLGVFAIKKFYNQALESGDIKLDQPLLLNWTGVHYVMQSWPGVVQPVNYAEDAGVANEPAVNYAAGGITSVPAALYAGYKVSVRIAIANTGPSNLHIGALFAPIRKRISEPLAAGDLAVGQVADFIYDGTNFQLQAPLAPLEAVLAAQALPVGFGNIDFAHTFGTVPTIARVVFVCTVAEFGYDIGDEVPISSVFYSNLNYSSPIGAYASSVRVRVIISANNPLFVTRDDAIDDQVALTRANWQVKVYARK